MAANLLPIPPPLAAVRASAGHQKSSDAQRKSSWWTPLFGWSGEPDYIIDAGNAETSRKNTLSARSGGVVSESDPDQRSVVRSRIISPANFTDEKARKLRMLTTETESFHDAMYHSAIASRLASDFSDRSSDL